MDIKEYIQELKRVTGNYTLKKYYKALTRIARNISPSERKTILNILEIVGNQNMEELDTSSLLEDIKSFYDRVESGKYYDHWDWDKETQKEREFGDECWADEMDAFFMKARHACEKKDYRLAVKAYKGAMGRKIQIECAFYWQICTASNNEVIGKVSIAYSSKI